MTDTELFALAVLAQAESQAMIVENQFRLRDYQSPAYPDCQVTTLDSLESLGIELRRRGTITEW